VFDDCRGDWPRLVEAACQISTYAVELSALSGSELPGLLRYLQASPALPFRYVSVHAPAKSFSERTALGQLLKLPLMVRTIVAHPDTLSEPQAFTELGTRLVLENMDARKPTGRTADELQHFFDLLPEAGFCFDVAHAWSIDPTMDLAHELLNRFRSRLRQVHVSSLDGNDHHRPLRSADERRFAEVLARCSDVPWILEALPPAHWTLTPPILWRASNQSARSHV
jgi:hypothetical protein